MELAIFMFQTSEFSGVKVGVALVQTSGLDGLGFRVLGGLVL